MCHDESLPMYLYLYLHSFGSISWDNVYQYTMKREGVEYIAQIVLNQPHHILPFEFFKS
jgi:hypothetical protein